MFEDKEVMDELRGQAAARTVFHRQEELVAGRRAIVEYLASPLGRVEGVHTDEDAATTEAIILEFGRPSLLVKDGTPETPASEVWRKRLQPHLARVASAIPGVGRIELRRHPDYEWVGTGWLIEGRYLITNRHVAMVFAEKRGGAFVFQRSPTGEFIEARIDFREEYERPTSFEVNIEKIVSIAPMGNLFPDMAVLRVMPHADLPTSVTLADRDPAIGDLIGVIGYPARDSRNGDLAMQRIFNDIFDVKRFAPGYVTVIDSRQLQHDSSTLGGNSGSPLFDLSSGRVVGLHFGGRFKEANYAVPVSVIKQTLVGVSVMGGGAAGGGAGAVERRTADDYDGRKGFDEKFLGRGFAVNLPELNEEQQDDAVEVDAARRGMEKYSLDYTHFSVVLCSSRRLAYYTAVNIDGSEDVMLRRRNTAWKIDPRVPAESQCGPDVYAGNNLDRGHLVRRLDPVWGDRDTARLADDDTFHYTNAAPQHERLNQKTWLSLEEYILGNAATRDFKVNVFTGPVFGAEDRDYRDIRIPSEFWKVVTMVTTDNKLRATAYILGQGDYLDDIEFVYGRFRTYQTSIVRIEKKTGLSFGKLSDFDPVGATEGIEFMRPITEAADIIL